MRGVLHDVNQRKSLIARVETRLAGNPSER
jgi:hypothetical protein